jgi:hypothetical protein
MIVRNIVIGGRLYRSTRGPETLRFLMHGGTNDGALGQIVYYREARQGERSVACTRRQFKQWVTRTHARWIRSWRKP